MTDATVTASKPSLDDIIMAASDPEVLKMIAAKQGKAVVDPQDTRPARKMPDEIILSEDSTPSEIAKAFNLSLAQLAEYIKGEITDSVGNVNKTIEETRVQSKEEKDKDFINKSILSEIDGAKYKEIYPDLERQYKANGGDIEQAWKDTKKLKDITVDKRSKAEESPPKVEGTPPAPALTSTDEEPDTDNAKPTTPRNAREVAENLLTKRVAEIGDDWLTGENKP